jgi:hypothetical protein
MLVSGTNQNQFKWTKVAISVHMPIFSISAQHGGLKGIPPSIVHSRWKWHAVLLAGEGIPHDNLALIAIDQDGEAVTAAHEAPLLTWAVSLRQGKTGVRDAVRRVQGGSEERLRSNLFCEEAEQRRLTVVFPEAFEKLGVGEDAAPKLADERGARKRGGLRREAEEDLLQKELVVQRRRWRQRVTAAAHLS